MRCADISTAMAPQCKRNREAEMRINSWENEHTRNGLLTYTMADLVDLPHPQYVLVDTDGWVAIDIGYGDNFYDFDASRIKTQLDLIEWVHHLCGKKWMDAKRVRQFISAICKLKGWRAKIEF